ncbi:CIC11C00000004639 [Sungouiella intermedia]|uniref:CIC11C00000004639 n=1 Tax=Sungouiella intermedia TaxID=45354 RepID=A0A1L0BNB0_9ASCO|nr:CIC11C00000004639 [[Candida] intermedia]
MEMIKYIDGETFAEDVLSVMLEASIFEHDWREGDVVIIELSSQPPKRAMEQWGTKSFSENVG